jgi:biopolymer transport protein ExbD
MTQSVNVALPKTASTTPDTQKQPLQLGVDAKGVITLNKTPIENLDALDVRLRNELAQNPEIAIHVWADQDVNYGKVAEVMATVQHAGISKMAFVTMEK